MTDPTPPDDRVPEHIETPVTPPDVFQQPSNFGHRAELHSFVLRNSPDGKTAVVELDGKPLRGIQKIAFSLSTDSMVPHLEIAMLPRELEIAVEQGIVSIECIKDTSFSFGQEMDANFGAASRINPWPADRGDVVALAKQFIDQYEIPPQWIEIPDDMFRYVTQRWHYIEGTAVFGIPARRGLIFCLGATHPATGQTHLLTTAAYAHQLAQHPLVQSPPPLDPVPAERRAAIHEELRSRVATSPVAQQWADESEVE